MTVRLRAARPRDVPALAALERASFSSDRLSPRQLARHAAGGSNACFVVAERDGVIVGNALVFFRRGARRARLYSIVVDRAARGLGLGARLLARIERLAKAAGAAELALEVRTRNTAAVALYERSGYRRFGTKRGYYEDGADAARYLKSLATPRKDSGPRPLLQRRLHR